MTAGRRAIAGWFIYLVQQMSNVGAELRYGKYTGWSKKRYPNFIFAITSVNVHRF